MESLISFYSMCAFRVRVIKKDSRLCLLPRGTWRQVIGHGPEDADIVVSVSKVVVVPEDNCKRPPFCPLRTRHKSLWLSLSVQSRFYSQRSTRSSCWATHTETDQNRRRSIHFMDCFAWNRNPEPGRTHLTCCRTRDRQHVNKIKVQVLLTN